MELEDIVLEHEGQEPEEEQQSPEAGQEERQAEEGAEPTGGEAEPGGEGAPQEAKPYTAEELEDILRNDGPVNPDRLSKEGLAVHRAYQRGMSAKHQALADLRRDMESFKQETSARIQQQTPPRDIGEAYDRNPQQIISNINAEIKRLSEEGAYEHAAKIEEFRDLKESLRQRSVEKQTTNLQTASHVQEVSRREAQKVIAVIPDWQTKQAKLTEFALTELGYSQEQLQRLTNPQYAGEMAATNIIAINKAYDKVNAKATLSQKESRRFTKVEKPGSGVEDNKKAPDMKALMQKASETGDWGPVYAAKGLNQEYE